MADLDGLIPFSAHNILLADGSRTIPERNDLLADHRWTRGALRSLDVVLDPGEVARIADLGCLEGGYAIEFGRRGHEVVGIEARRLNADRAEAARAALGLANVRIVHDDAKNVERHGMFDVVFCSGLLYHLEDPAGYLQTLGRITRRALLLNTHWARDIDPMYDPPGVPDPARTDFGLGPLTEHEGLPGRWYPEYDEDASRESIERRLWAAHSNARSFWPTRGALVEACSRAGFDTVYEQCDTLEDPLDDQYTAANDRSTFVCVKSDPARGRAGRLASLASTASYRAAKSARAVRRTVAARRP